MGEYIRNPRTGDVVKIGVMDEAFFSREALLKFKEEGWRGWYNEKYDESLKNMLEDPNTLYRMPDECGFDSEVHTVMVENNGISHGKVYPYIKGNRGSIYSFQVDCKQQDEKEIWAVLIGMRYDEMGRPRSIFKCDCCGKLFSISEEEAYNLREKHPYWSKWIIPNPMDKILLFQSR